jgi:hypothetical protein
LICSRFRLARDLDELLAQVDPDRALDDRHDEHPARTLHILRARSAEREHEQALVLVDDLDGRPEQEKPDQDDEHDRQHDRQDLHRVLLGFGSRVA